MLQPVTDRSISDGLLELTPKLRLIGGRDRATGRIVFPLPANSDSFEPYGLPDAGLLWSYTVQRFAPKSPPYLADGPFEPFAVGYVELAGALIVESRLVEVPFQELRIGLPMELTTFALRTDAGDAVLMYAFKPSAGSPP